MEKACLSVWVGRLSLVVLAICLQLYFYCLISYANNINTLVKHNFPLMDNIFLVVFTTLAH